MEKTVRKTSLHNQKDHDGAYWRRQSPAALPTETLAQVGAQKTLRMCTTWGGRKPPKKLKNSLPVRGRRCYTPK